MKRRSLLALAGALAALPSLAFAQDEMLDRVTAYIDGLDTVVAEFRQGNPDGSISSGTFYMNRPGLMRFEYDLPNPAVVIADGVWVAVVDRASNAEPQRYPINSTPLRLLLRENVDFANDASVRSVEERSGMLLVTVEDPDAPENGTLELGFSQEPFALREWAVTNGAGETTVVVIDSMERDVPLERRLFSIEWEALQR
ncbi:MAG: LolA family protein [Rubricella sp.]